jgi:transcriptional regulator with XRE-family HTH domain
MSLSDYIKYLRALRGGVTPREIEQDYGIPARDVHLIEVKHRRVGEDDALLQKLADYFGVPVAELARRREAYRKRLTYFLDEHKKSSVPVVLMLENGEELAGTVAWYSREAVALAAPEEGEDGVMGGGRPYIVQRAWIADWRPADSPNWQVESAVSGAPGNTEHAPPQDDEHK